MYSDWTKDLDGKTNYYYFIFDTHQNTELFGPGHFIGLGLGLRLKSEIRTRTRTRART
jgi:hypothetical protein